VAPVGAVSKVALDGDHLTGDVDDLLWLHVRQGLGHRDEGLWLVVGAAEPAPDQHVEAAKLSSF